MKKRIFSLLLMAIMIVTCFITGCSAAKKTSSTNTKSAKKVKNIGRMKSNVDVRRYIHDVNWGRDVECQNLDFKEYLVANGATDIWYVDSDDDYNCIMCKFNNNIFVAFSFDALDSFNHCPLMNEFCIVSGKDGFHPTFHDAVAYGNMEGNDLASSWVRKQDLLEDDDDEVDDESDDDSDDEDDDETVIKIKDYRLAGRFDSKDFVSKIAGYKIPQNFDREFKRTIRPYLDLDEVSLKEDPFSTDSEIGGYSVNHDQ